MANQAMLEWLLSEAQKQFTADLVKGTLQVVREDDFDGATKFLATKLRLCYQHKWIDIDWDAVATQLLLKARRDSAA